MRVKICGITSPEDAQHAAAAGVDAIGLVFYKKSKRLVSPEQANEIIASLPPFVTTVGLFLDEDAEAVHKTVSNVPLDLLQFHGSESPEYCRSFKRPYIKGAGIKGLSDPHEIARQYSDAQALLLDSHATGEAGGTGKTFDWSLLPKDLQLPLILAGGLTPDNVGEALKQHNVYALDLSSGVESSPGRKCQHKIRQLMQTVKQAQAAMEPIR